MPLLSGKPSMLVMASIHDAAGHPVLQNSPTGQHSRGIGAQLKAIRPSKAIVAQSWSFRCGRAARVPHTTLGSKPNSSCSDRRARAAVGGIRRALAGPTDACMRVQDGGCAGTLADMHFGRRKVGDQSPYLQRWLRHGRGAGARLQRGMGRVGHSREAVGICHAAPLGQFPWKQAFPLQHL